MVKKDSGATAAAQINIGIADKDRRKIAEGLSRLLAGTYSLHLKTHYFHWNVTGPMFNMLHLMFETQYNELWDVVDPVAERIRVLGYPAPGSYSEFARLSSIPESKSVPGAMDMVRELVAGYEVVTRTTHSLLPDIGKAADEPTADLLTQRMNIHEETAWMLRSLLVQGWPEGRSPRLRRTFRQQRIAPLP